MKDNDQPEGELPNVGNTSESEAIAKRRLKVEGKTTRPESSTGSDSFRGHKLPRDVDVPVWFEEAEKIIKTFGVPQNNRVHLIIPALSDRVRYPYVSLSVEEVADYEKVKAAILEELRLTPG